MKYISIQFVYKGLMPCFFILLLSCNNDESAKEETFNCTCILDELYERKTVLDEKKNLDHSSINRKINPKISVLAKKIIDLDLALNLELDKVKSESENKLELQERNSKFDSNYIQNYLTAREIFCAKYRTYCNDRSLPDSLKTVLYIKELEKLEKLLRNVDSATKNLESKKGGNKKNQEKNTKPIVRNPDLKATMSLHIGGFHRIRLMNPGNVTLKECRIRIMSWRNGAPAEDLFKTIEFPDLIPGSDWYYDIDIFRATREHSGDERPRPRILGYMTTSCINFPKPKSFAFCIPSEDERNTVLDELLNREDGFLNESELSFYSHGHWLIEFDYSEKEPIRTVYDLFKDLQSKR